jgi:DNA polymerase-3 subunit beta
MKLTVSRLDLLAAVGKVQAVVHLKPALPVLGSVLLEARDDELVLSATDLTVSLRAFTDAKVTEEGAIAVPGRRFAQLVRELTAPEVVLQVGADLTVHIHAGNSHFKMNGMQKSEFPTFPDLSHGVPLLIETKILREVLERSAFAAARDDNRQILNGILLRNLKRQASFIGTDGKRLAKVIAEVDLPEEHEGAYVLPLKAVEEIVKLLDPKEEKVALILMPDKIGIEAGSVTLISKLLVGQYPDVSRVIPKKSAAPIQLHREELMTILRQVSLFTTDGGGAVKFTFSPGELHISAMHGEIGEGKVSMPVNYGGAKFDIAFNPHYFLDILRHTTDETVELSLGDPYSPGLITDSSQAEFVLMPMRFET